MREKEFVFFFCLLITGQVMVGTYGFAAEQAVITVDLEQDARRMNLGVFGQSVIAYDPCRSCMDGCTNHGRYSNFGAGFWMPAQRKTEPVLLRLAGDIRVTSMRFPGGCGAHFYNWKKTIGPVENRPMFQFGLDEFLTLCKQLKADPTIVMSYFTGTDADLADLVEYLNDPLKAMNPNGGINWAQRRAENGHPVPYGVRFFEFGNEVYHGDHCRSLLLDPVEYGKRYTRCRDIFHKVDPAMRLGLVVQADTFGLTAWGRQVLSAVADHEIDFSILHIYPFTYSAKHTVISAGKLFRMALTASAQVRGELERIQRQLESTTGKNVPLFITEYNGQFVQNEPVPYRHSLGNALLNADLLRVLLTTDANIQQANYHQFANSYWGTVYNRSYSEGGGQYVKRPNYFVFKLFADYLLPFLVKAEVRSGGYQSGTYGGANATGLYNNAPESTAAKKKSIISPDEWKTSNTWQWISSKKEVRVKQQKDFLLLEFSFNRDINYYHTSVTRSVEPGRRYRLTGLMKTEKLISKSGLGIEIQSEQGWQRDHWAESTQHITGTTDWKTFSVEFQPPPEADYVKIILRHYGGSGDTLSGRVEVKDMVLEDVGPAVHFPPTLYLSVVAGTDETKKKLNLIVINKNLEHSLSVQVHTIGFHAAENGKFRVLNGPAIDSTNEDGRERVKITGGEFSVQEGGDHFNFTFAAHSVTALELSGE